MVSYDSSFAVQFELLAVVVIRQSLGELSVATERQHLSALL
jgi:hypothetical protein